MKAKWGPWRERAREAEARVRQLEQLHGEDQHVASIKYLLKSANVLIQAADALIGMRDSTDSQPAEGEG
jgi:hypothetical protein